MDRHWSREARSFAKSMRSAVDRLGGVEFARQVEADPGLRESRLRPVVDQLGLAEIEMLDNRVDAEVAACAARVAGSFVLPWPVGAQLARPSEEDGAVYLTLDRPNRLEHLDLFGTVIAVDLRTRAPMQVRALGAISHMPLDPFGVACQVVSTDAPSISPAQASRSVDAHIVLDAYYVVGALERATVLAAEYARERHQFGHAIATFGAIQWRLSDIVVARDGLAEIAGYTLWRFGENTATPADTLALRLATIDAAAVVLSNAHQVFGAIGLCEEHDLTVLDRHLQPLLRRPAGITATSAILRDAIFDHGFDGIFPVRPLAPVAEAPL